MHEERRHGELENKAKGYKPPTWNAGIMLQLIWDTIVGDAERNSAAGPSESDWKSYIIPCLSGSHISYTLTDSLCYVGIKAVGTALGWCGVIAGKAKKIGRYEVYGPQRMMQVAALALYIPGQLALLGSAGMKRHLA